jgi:hypothetical protein
MNYRRKLIERLDNMNLYEKLRQARVELQNSNLKKSGKNTFSNYTYYELGDFLPTINNICLEKKIFPHVSFFGDGAILTILNIEKPDEIVEFNSPHADAQLKGCHPIQNLGAVETYQRRYLYMAAFEIVEHDALDATTAEPAKPAPLKATPPDPAKYTTTPPPLHHEEKPVDMAKWWAQVGKLGLGDKEVHAIAGRESLKGMSRVELTELYDKCKITAAEKKGEI